MTWPYPGVDNDTTLRARASPCPVQTYYSSSKQPQQAVTICSIATSTGTVAAVGWYVTGYANTWYLVRRFIRVHTYVRNYKCRSNIIKDTKNSSHFRKNWYTIKKIQAMNVQRDRSFRYKCEMHARRERVSGILLKLESLPGANEVSGHDRGKHYLLSTYDGSTL